VVCRAPWAANLQELNLQKNDLSPRGTSRLAALCKQGVRVMLS
jgi:hypothetical protein